MSLALSDALRADMERKGIDIPLSLEILEDYNAGLYDGVAPIEAAGVPAIDGQTVVDLRRTTVRTGGIVYSSDAEKAKANLASFGMELPEGTTLSGKKAHFNAEGLRAIGSALLSRTAYGVLNGGSATSYADRKKNLALGRETFAAAAPYFEKLAPLCEGQPKGITPAYVNPDGSPGASFLELKMRARLLMASGRSRASGGGDPFLPLFQMTSSTNDEVLSEYFEKAHDSPFLSRLATERGLESARWRTGVQPMIAAFTHSSEGRPKRIFDRAHGAPDSAIALPGGHGQCFRVLASVLGELREAGIRYACLGNVDNLGYAPDPAEMAIMAISGQPAGFDFSVRTPMDVKGGILVETAQGSRTVADIGPAIRFEEVLDLERRGFSILFNCASGIFDLEYLVPRIGEIAKRLPVRFSDQDKDAGRYSQAEQVTWEVTGILPSFLAFAVDKSERFLAAKLLVDTLLTSGIGIDDASVPANVRETASRMHAGLESLLRGVYGLKLADGRWIPAELAGRG